ncbi:MAG: alpha/beta hydrolase-fold protein [Actinomycetota bacterium]|nr:alpha/beta hydrolase-fold protein [Actinomycetota bacterium]
MSNPLDWPLLSGPFPAIVLAAGLLAVAWLVAARNAGRRSSESDTGTGTGTGRMAPSLRWLAIYVPVIALAAGAVITVLTWLVNHVWRPFPDPLPSAVVFWSWVALTGVALALIRQPLLRTWPRRAAALAAGALVLAAAANQINASFQAYSSLRVALAPWLNPAPVLTRTVPVRQIAARPGRSIESIWHPPPGMPKTGRVYQVTIPGSRSGFAARPGYVYLPPAYLATPRPQLPVLVLLAGQPGDPSQWVDSGGLQAMMDSFARRHHGLAPVVVMPDDLGGEFANPMCLNSRLGNVQTYLTVDVPHWITSHLQVRPPGRGWAIGGFSHGGTCAIQLTTQAPRLYPVFVDISGQRGPTLGNPQLTISRAFGGNAAALARVAPLAVLAHTRFPHNTGVFVAGSTDHVYAPQQRTVYLAARHAGMRVTFMTLPGGHDWGVWRPGLQRNLAWLASRMGITGAAR